MCLRTSSKFRLSCVVNSVNVCSKCCCLVGYFTLSPAALKGVRGRAKPLKDLVLLFKKSTQEHLLTQELIDSSWINLISSTPSTEYFVFPTQIPNLLLHLNLSFHALFPLPILFFPVFPSLTAPAGNPGRGGSWASSYKAWQHHSFILLSNFLSLKSRWFSFCALQCQLTHQAASALILDKTLSLSLPAFHKASMYPIKFVLLFPDKMSWHNS